MLSGYLALVSAQTENTGGNKHLGRDRTAAVLHYTAWSDEIYMKLYLKDIYMPDRRQQNECVSPVALQRSSCQHNQHRDI